MDEREKEAGGEWGGVKVGPSRGRNLDYLGFEGVYPGGHTLGCGCFVLSPVICCSLLIND